MTDQIARIRTILVDIEAELRVLGLTKSNSAPALALIVSAKVELAHLRRILIKRGHHTKTRHKLMPPPQIHFDDDSAGSEPMDDYIIVDLTIQPSAPPVDIPLLVL